MSIFNEYYRREIRKDWSRSKAPVPTRKKVGTASLSVLFSRLSEANGNILQGVEDILLPAKEFLTQQLSSRQDISSDSPETTFLNGVMGIIQQFDPSSNPEDYTQGMLREKIGLMADKLEALIDRNDYGSIGDYITKLVSGLRQYKNRIDPASDSEPLTPDETEAPEEEIPENPEAETPEGEEAAPEEEEEPEDDTSQLARELGIS